MAWRGTGDIIWNNSDTVHWRIYALLGGDELNIWRERKIVFCLFSCSVGNYQFENRLSPDFYNDVIEITHIPGKNKSFYSTQPVDERSVPYTVVKNTHKKTSIFHDDKLYLSMNSIPTLLKSYS